MPFNTKLNLIDDKFIQHNTGVLTLSGTTCVGTATYLSDKSATYTARSIPDVAFVTGRTSLGITTANNGLTKAGTNVHLGGTLTGATTIIFPVSPTTQLTFTDSRTPPIGVQYGGDYSAAVTARSIPDAAFVTGRTSLGITTANNGLTKAGTNVHLGGVLTGTTNINGPQTLKINVCTLSLTGTTGFNLSTGNGVITDTGTKGGLQYAVAYDANVVALSIPNAAWVTGKTKTITAIGSVNQVIYRDSTKLTGCTNMIYCDACKSFAFGVGNTASGANTLAFGRTNAASGVDSAIFGGYNSTAAAVCSAIIGGQSNCICTTALRSAIIGGQSIILTGSTYDDTVAVNCLAIMCTPTTYAGDVLTYNTLSKKIGITPIASLGSITGATNGIGTTTLQRVCLGGALIAGTSITGNFALCLGTTGANRLASLDLRPVGALTIVTGTLPISSSGATFSDLTLTTKEGIKYTADYSATYNIRSLVDKGYVDTVATGLHVQTAVKVATTASITLANNQTIDGIAVVNPDRVLVKNQGIGTTGNSTNGIYVVVDAGPWTRVTDYDVSAEISNGDLIPVTTGDTQHNTLWVLTTQNPITLNTTPLEFTLFSTVTDVHAGAGIAISQVGAQHTVCVLLPGGSGAACGLAVTTSGLCVASSIANSGLTYTTGALCVNAAKGGIIACSIPVKFDSGCGLVVNCADIGAAVGAITTANNGITNSGGNIHLGGVLTGTTKICGNNSYGFTLTGLSTINLDFGAGNVAGIIKDNNSSPRGFQYNGDYSATFCDNSLISKKYVCSQTSGITTGYLCTANNGLTKAGQNVRLGGSLTGTTNINGPQTLKINVCTLSLTGTTAFNLSTGNGVITDTGSRGGLQYAAAYDVNVVCLSIPNAGWVTGKTSTSGIQSANNGLNKAGTNVRLGGSLTGTTRINGTQTFDINVTTFNLSGNTAVNITGATVNLGGIVTLQKTPVSGVALVDEVLAWNSSDKQIKIVSGSALGERNNVYSKTIITTSATGTTGSTYVILVSAATTSTFTLPSTPLTGQAFKIKDACGNALTNNIIIDSGLGKLIDGSRCALINTDYGALELVYAATNKWYSLAFIN